MLRSAARTVHRARAGALPTRAMSGDGDSFDVVIVGGGVMGSAAAFFLSQRMDPSRICVVERDMTYARASSPLSVGSIRQQFSVPENIRMSIFGAGFLRDVDRHLRPDGDDDPVDVQFHEEGYLFLATPETRPVLEENHATQQCATPRWRCAPRGGLAALTACRRAEGASVAFLEADELSRKYPWLVTDGVSAGCYGERPRLARPAAPTGLTCAPLGRRAWQGRQTRAGSTPGPCSPLFAARPPAAACTT